MENLKQKISNELKNPSSDNLNFFDVTQNENLVTSKLFKVQYPKYFVKTQCEIWTKAIQKALDENENVYIPNIGKPIYIDAPLMIKSNSYLKVSPNQIVSLVPNSNCCILRNENINFGRNEPITLDNENFNITIEGGIWSTLSTSRQTPNLNTVAPIIKEEPTYGHGVMVFANIKNLTIKNLSFANCYCYGIQISNCENFICDNIFFSNHYRDGIHINGPAKNGYIGNLSADKIGDDLVALNAWDWYHSVLSFGTIENIIVENIKSTHNEIRLLPGRKIYPNDISQDCDIKNCVFENIEGIYTFKMYCQPNLEDITQKDRSATVGNIKNIYFNNIRFKDIEGKGFFDIPANGIFDICADCDNINFYNIDVEDDIETLLKKEVSLLKIGPTSATWKRCIDSTQYSNENSAVDSQNWIEIFEPDAICTAENLNFANITFNNKKTDIENKPPFIKEQKLEINDDYPNTTPKGGTGYGKARNIINCK